MNSIHVLSFVLAVTVYGVTSLETGNDGFDMKAAVANVDVLKGMVGCFLDTNPCDAVGTGFKKVIAEAIESTCTKCTDIQKSQMNIFLHGLKDKLPKEFEDLKNRYDPGQKYFTELEANVAGY